MSLSTGHETATAVEATDLVPLTIDGIEVQAPKGSLLIRVAEELGIAIPRFCDHPLLAPAGACRQCLVEVSMPDREGNLRAMPKPQASCTMTVAPGMVVATQRTSEVADKAQHGIMELLLVNHPLDCPICDKGGECPLQNQAMSNGRGETRFVDVKRTFAKPIKISTQVLLDRERCILCQRCTRFSKEIAGDTFIDLQKRGAAQQIGTFDTTVLGYQGALTEGAAELDEAGSPFASYFSGNTIQICPVGALTGAAYRFRARPFDLVSSHTVCEHCASGCAVRADHRRGVVLRRLAGEDPVVNEEWNCDKGRWAFTYATLPDRLTTPMVRDETTGELVETSWPDALDVAARGLAAARDAQGVGTLVGGRLTVEDAYAYAKFARVVLRSNDVDMRARPSSVEEEAFLASAVAGTGIGVTYADLEKAPSVVLVGLEAEEESPILFLRLRKAVRNGALTVTSLAPLASRGLEKLDGVLVHAHPGSEAAHLRAAARSTAADPLAVACRREGAVLLVGERLATSPGALSAAAALAEATGARLAWVPRRAGERGAVEAGALPGVLPGGRPAASRAAQVDVAAAWGVDRLPTRPGLDTAGILAAAGQGAGLLVAGVEVADLPDPRAAEAALRAASFVVSLEVRSSSVTAQADVVLPVAPVAEKDGSFMDWEGRLRPFEAVLHTDSVSDHAVLDELAQLMGVELGAGDTRGLRDELAQIGAWDDTRAPAPDVEPATPAEPGAGQAVLATWHLLLDAGRGQDGEAYLAGTAHRAHARMSPATAADHGLTGMAHLQVSTSVGALVLPLVEDRSVVDGVVWLPTRSRGSELRTQLGAQAGDLVGIAPAPDQLRTGGEA